MKCPVCFDEVKELDKPRHAHLVLHKDHDNHVHIHGDMDKKEAIKEMLELAGEEVGVNLGQQTFDRKEIVFHNKQRIGDMLVFTCGVRDFKAAFPHVRVNVIATAPHIWDHNPNIDRTLVPTPENTVKIGPGELTNGSNRKDWHFTNAYRVSIEKALNIVIPQGESRPDIYLTQEEYDSPRVFENPYWIICITGEKGWGCKMYPFTKWQEFVNQNPDITFVQIGAKEDNPPRLQGPNVIDYVGRTQSKENGIRDLFKLFLNAEGSIGLVSFHMHLSGALSKPAIVVAGAREPVHFTRYPGHAYLATDGMLPCAVKACWHCAIETCTNPVKRINQNNQEEIVPKCVDIIEPTDLTRALRGFYDGGRLVKGVPSAKPKFKNIVPTPAKVPSPPPEQEINTHGLSWGCGALLKEDWQFISSLIDEHKVKTVLEFGAGLSSLLFYDKGVDLVTYENQQRWIKQVKEWNPELTVFHWDGKDALIPMMFGMAFVDGPAGPQNRRDAMRLAAKHARIVVVHDGSTVWEKEHMKEMFPESDWHQLGKGGRRCYLYIKKDNASKTAPECPTIDLPCEMDEESFKTACAQPGKNPQGKVPLQTKHVKIVTTAKGWGGQARSITTIMRLLLKAGHRVEFIPFRNAVTSSEMKTILSGELKNVTVTEHYNTVQERCDVLFMYADDYVWEFGKPDIVSAFENIGAERKVMMLNYRRGKVGELEWTRGWDKYMFLNSTQERELLTFLPGAKTKVLPPCTDLTPFFEVIVDYNGPLRLVRHSSQGDTKFPKDFGEEIDKIMKAREDVQFFLLPGPSWVMDVPPRIHKFKRTADPHEIARFLSHGNLFWYSLPQGYMDMGPRVILEAMAAGLPVLADNWGGAVDRVPRETGWLCDEKNQHVEIIKHLSSKELRQKGEAAREHARKEFVPERWIEEILC